nr:DUF1116 domain-containing protein [Candidatus Dormibacteraeota bacterium]
MSATDRSGLLGRPLQVANAGVELFANTLSEQGVPVEPIDWLPPAAGSERVLARLAAHEARVAEANDYAVGRLQEAKPMLMGVGRAGELLPDFDRHTLLHAGPPIDWPDMSGPLRGAVLGAIIYEGLADDADTAERLAASGALSFAPCHERGAVGPMAGVVSASMPMWMIENVTHGNRAYCTFNEGLGKVLRYGAYDAEVQERLHWLADSLAPVMSAALARLGPLDLRSLIAQALQMGDEGHNRNRACTSLFLRQLAPLLPELMLPSAQVARAAAF